jgi:hypothetical protein
VKIQGTKRKSQKSLDLAGQLDGNEEKPYPIPKFYHTEVGVAE